MIEKIVKIAEIGPYPPPNNGWSFRIKLLKEGINNRSHCRCEALNTGKSRRMKSSEYIGVQNSMDYAFKLILLRIRGYKFHLHANAQAVKGPLLVLVAHVISILTFSRAAMTFHGGYIQLNFPKKKGKKMYPIIYLNFLLSKIIICNDRHIKSDIHDYGLFINSDKIFSIQAFSKQYVSLEKAPLTDEMEAYISKKKHLIVCYASFREGFYLDILCHFIEQMQNEIGLIIVGADPVEDENVRPFAEQLKEYAKDKRILLKGAVEHGQFVALLGKSQVFLRTYISDGVASSVLEALIIGTVVVASDNGRRPEGVVTYRENDPEDLKAKIFHVLENQDMYKKRIKKPEIKDTVQEEIDVLCNHLR